MTRRLYRLLLVAYSREFREQHGAESAALFSSLLDEAQTVSAKAGLWRRTIVSVVAHGLAERREHRRPSDRTSDRSIARTLAGVVRDSALGLRLWRRTPWHAVVATSSLALGVGVTVSVVNVLLAVFYWSAVPGADRLAAIGVVTETGTQWSVSPTRAQALIARTTTFEELAAERFGWIWLTGAGPAIELQGALVTFNYFDVLGLQPSAGRLFRADDAGVVSPHAVVVISHRLWGEQFGSSPGVIGRTVQINEEPAVIVGVAPARFRGRYQGQAYDAWIPHDLSDRQGRGAATALYRADGAFELVGRLGPDRSRSTAASEVTTLLSALADQETSDQSDQEVVAPRAVVEPLRGVHPDDRRSFSGTPAVSAGVAGALLALTCLNLGGLLSSRNAGRRRELTVRLALGGTRRRLIAQLCAENLGVAVVTAAVAVGSAELSQRLVSQWFAYPLPGLRLDFDVVTVGVAVVLATFAVVGFSIIPAIVASRRLSLTSLRDRQAASAGSVSRGHVLLMAGQVALSLMLVVGAAVMGDSLSRALSIGGHHSDAIVHYRLRPSRAGYSEADASAYYGRLLMRLREVPAVRSAALARVGIERGGCCVVAMKAADQPASPPLQVDNNHVTPEFFGMMEVPVIAGRTFNSGDRTGAPPVVMVNAALALRLWPETSPLGRFVIADDVTYEVVGVAGNVHPSRPGEGPVPFAYFSYAQLDGVDGRLFVQVSGDVSTATRDVHAAIAGTAADVHVGQGGTLEERLLLGQAPQVALLGVLRVSALAALLLSAIGLHGLLLVAVHRRHRDDAIRLALGASPHDVVKAVGVDVVKVLLPGLVLGAVLAWIQGRLLQAYLFGTAPVEPGLFVLASVVLLVVGLVAAVVPARRAAAVEPAVLLRNE